MTSYRTTSLDWPISAIFFIRQRTRPPPLGSREASLVAFSLPLSPHTTMFGGFGVGMGGMPQRFEECYHCYSVAYADKSHLEVSRVVLVERVESSHRTGSIHANTSNPRLEGRIDVNQLPARGAKGRIVFATDFWLCRLLLIFFDSSLILPRLIRFDSPHSIGTTDRLTRKETRSSYHRRPLTPWPDFRSTIPCCSVSRTRRRAPEHTAACWNSPPRRAPASSPFG